MVLFSLQINPCPPSAALFSLQLPLPPVVLFSPQLLPRAMARLRFHVSFAVGVRFSLALAFQRTAAGNHAVLFSLRSSRERGPP